MNQHTHEEKDMNDRDEFGLRRIPPSIGTGRPADDAWGTRRRSAPDRQPEPYRVTRRGNVTGGPTGDPMERMVARARRHALEDLNRDPDQIVGRGDPDSLEAENRLLGPGRSVARVGTHYA